MAKKATYDPTAKTITLDQIAPVDGFVEMDVQQDFYSDAKIQWLDDLSLNGFTFPWLAIGGQPLPGGAVAPRIYFLAAGWKIIPWADDHQLDIAENLFSEDGSRLFSEAPGNHQIAISVTNTLATGDDRVGDILSLLLSEDFDQRIRDAMYKAATNGTLLEQGSVDQKLNRIQLNTLPKNLTC